MSITSRIRLAQARLEGGRDPGRVARVCRHCSVDLVGVGRRGVIWIDRDGDRRCRAPYYGVRLEHAPRPRLFRIGAGGAVSSSGERG